MIAFAVAGPLKRIRATLCVY